MRQHDCSAPGCNGRPVASDSECIHDRSHWFCDRDCWERFTKKENDSLIDSRPFFEALKLQPELLQQELPLGV